MGVMEYNFNDHYLVYAELELNHNNVKQVHHNSAKFRDMTNFNPETCNKNVPIKVARLKDWKRDKTLG